MASSFIRRDLVALGLEAGKLGAHLGDVLEMPSAGIFQFAAQLQCRRLLRGSRRRNRLYEELPPLNLNQLMRESVDPIDLARQPQHGLARGFRSGMLGRLREKTLEVVERGA